MTAASTIALSPSIPDRRDSQRGFTLTELAIVLFIVALLMSSLMYTLSAQTEQRAREQTLQRLEEAKELILGFAALQGRMPCPASAASNGDESFASGSAAAGGGVCSNYLDGFVPARAIGFQPVDDFGYAQDAWGNRLRYVLARTSSNPSGGSGCTVLDPAFTRSDYLQQGGVACAPVNLVICDATQNTVAGSPPSCGTWGTAGDARPVTNQLTVAAIVFSTGKSGATGPAGNDEAENLDADGVFVWHEPRPQNALGGEYDDLMAWVAAGAFYQRLIAAGVLP